MAICGVHRKLALTKQLPLHVVPTGTIMVPGEQYLIMHGKVPRIRSKEHLASCLVPNSRHPMCLNLTLRRSKKQKQGLSGLYLCIGYWTALTRYPTGKIW